MTHSISSPGWRLRQALVTERPLQMVGTINALTALMAQKTGYKAIYLSGAGVANASYGLPDLGLTSRENVVEDIRRITDAVDVPLLVDGDTGWGDALGIARTIKQFQRAGAAGIHLEDQLSQKRCGHRPGKKLVSADEMCDRIAAAADAKSDSDFVLMARTDAYGVEGLAAAIDRALRYVAAGADMIFAEAMTSLAEYQQFTQAVEVPVLANITEFGKTPLFSAQELGKVGVQLVLYPLSAFRAMNQAALSVYQAIRRDGTQQAVLATMQTRDELYELIDYLSFEEKMDALFGKEIRK